MYDSLVHMFMGCDIHVHVHMYAKKYMYMTIKNSPPIKFVDQSNPLCEPQPNPLCDSVTTLSTNQIAERTPQASSTS